MRIEEPFTGVEVKEKAIHFEKLINRLRARFPHHENEETPTNASEIVVLEHNKFVVEKLMKKLTNETSHVELQKLLDFTKKITADLDNDIIDKTQVFDVDEFLKERAKKDKETLEKEDFYDATYHVKIADLEKEFTNPNVSKAKNELKILHEKLEEKIKNRVNF